MVANVRSLFDTHDGTKIAGFISQLDARARIIAVIMLASTVITLNHWPILLTLLFLVFVPLLLSGLPLAVTFRRILTMDLFVIFLIVMLPFTIPGTAFLTIGSLAASWEGLERAFIIGLKANVIMMALVTFIGSMDATLLGQALYRLKCPTNLVHLLLFTIRYVDLIQQEYNRLRTSMRARAFQMKNNLHSYKTIGFLIGMLLIRSIERSERILNAMKCRGFDGRLYISYAMQWRKRDTAFIVCLFASSLFLLFGSPNG